MIKARPVVMAVLALVAASLLPVAGWAGPSPANDGWAPGPIEYGVASQTGIKVPMADGVELTADITFPVGKDGRPASGPFPVILTQTPYGKTASAQSGMAPIRYLVERGYIHAVADVRGTGGSGGKWGLFDEVQAEDGAALVKWAAALPNSSGKVGLIGPSYLGINQFFTAAKVGKGSPLKAIFPIVAANDLYRDTAFDGGLINTEFGAPYLGMMVGANALNPVAERYQDPVGLVGVEADHAAGAAHLQLPLAQSYLTTGEEAYDGQYWSSRRPANVLQQVVDNEIPAFLVGGWRDLFQRGAPMNYAGLQNAWAGRPVGAPMTADQPVTGRYQLLMGPWYHLDFGAGLDLNRIALQWFDTWLKDRPTGMAESQAPLHVYDLGTSQWSDTDRYPFTAARPTTLHLGEGGTLGTAAPAAKGADTIVYTGLSSPCGLPGTQSSTGFSKLIFGPYGEGCVDDDRSQQYGPGALTYTTEPVTEPTVVAGPIGVSLFATSTRPDTQWVAIVEDVSPDGRSRALSSGALLGSFRQVEADHRTWAGPDGRPILPHHAYTKASSRPVETGQVERYDIEVRPVMATLAAGHRLRLTLNTSAVHVNPTPAQFANLVGGVYSVQRGGDYGQGSTVQVPMAPAGTVGKTCDICH